MHKNKLDYLDLSTAGAVWRPRFRRLPLQSLYMPGFESLKVAEMPFGM
jgi:hypothetical protein